MKLILVIGVWGAWHLNVFKKKALPTILHESNLPALGLDAEFRIYTHENERGALLEASEAIAKHVPCEIFSIGLPEGYKTAWQHACGSTASENLVMFLQPDIVWSIGSFPHIGERIKAGKRMIFCPQMRGTESFYTGLPLTGQELMAICHEDAHPVNKSEEAGIIGFTRHPEVILWPVRGGWVCRMFAREPLVCDPAMKFNSQNLPDSPIDGDLVDVIASSDDACGISLCKREQEYDHYRGGTMLMNAERVGQLTKGHPSSVALPVALQHSILRYGLMDQEEVDKAIRDSHDFAVEALEWIIRPERKIPKRAGGL